MDTVIKVDQDKDNLTGKEDSVNDNVVYVKRTKIVSETIEENPEPSDGDGE